MLQIPKSDYVALQKANVFDKFRKKHDCPASYKTTNRYYIVEHKEILSALAKLKNYA